MTGMNRLTGKPLSGLEHIAQSIRTIVTTPLRSRVMRRTFGSELPRLIDAPLNNHTRALMCAACAGAIAKWEPRIKLTRVRLSDPDASGSLTLILEARRVDIPELTDASPRLTLTIPL